MENLKKAFNSAASKIPKGGVGGGGGGMISGIVKGGSILFGLGVAAYGFSESIVTGKGVGGG